MNLVCRVEGLTLTKPCEVKTCMWYSHANKSGCFGNLQLEAADLTDEVVAKHKAMSVQQVSALKDKGIDAITASTTMAGFVFWVSHKKDVMERMVFLANKRKKTITKWSQKFPIYTTKAVKWTPEAIIASTMKAYWDRFCKSSGVNASDWPDILGIDDTDITALHSLLQRGKYEKTVLK